MLQTYTWPIGIPASKRFQVFINGTPVLTHPTNVADFSLFALAGPASIEVRLAMPAKDVSIRPHSQNIPVACSGNAVHFTLPGPCKVKLDVPGHLPLYLFANPVEDPAPFKNRTDTLFLEAGKVHNLGLLPLQENQTLYLEGGAILRGCIHASHAHHLTIRGMGILDGSFFAGKQHQRSILVKHSQHVAIQDITLIHPTTWMTVLYNCRHVQIRNLKEIGEIVSSDGIDVCSSQDVLIQECFLHNNDDCIVLKAFNLEDASNAFNPMPSPNVERVRVEGCTLANMHAGNAMEIGHELRAENIKDVTFSDCDVLHVHGHGAVFSIHNGDRAAISNITWNNIRIEHFYDKLVDFRILNSMWSRDSQRGQVQNITLQNIHVIQSQYNPGYSVSLIGGWDPQHRIQNVVFRNLTFNQRKITSIDPPLDMYLRHADNITFD